MLFMKAAFSTETTEETIWATGLYNNRTEVDISF